MKDNFEFSYYIYDCLIEFLICVHKFSITYKKKTEGVSNTQLEIYMIS